MRERERESKDMKESPSSTKQSSDKSMLVKKCLRPRKEIFEKIMEQCLVFTQDRQLYSPPPARLDYSYNS